MPKDVRLVVGSGAGGGLVSWALTLMAGSTFGLGPWAALPLCVILGAAAALVAVYVITPTDTSKTGKLIGFALLCGIVWKPVLDAGRIVIGERVGASQAAGAVEQHVADLKTARTPQDVAARTDQAAAGATDLLRTSETLDNPSVTKQATTQASAAVNAIAETSTADPVNASLALRDIKAAADNANNPEVSALAAKKIDMLAHRLPPGVAVAIQEKP